MLSIQKSDCSRLTLILKVWIPLKSQPKHNKTWFLEFSHTVALLPIDFIVLFRLICWETGISPDQKKNCLPSASELDFTGPWPVVSVIEFAISHYWQTQPTAAYSKTTYHAISSGAAARAKPTAACSKATYHAISSGTAAQAQRAAAYSKATCHLIPSDAAVQPYHCIHTNNYNENQICRQ